MSRFSNLSIRSQLVLQFALATSIGLMLAVAIFVMQQVRSNRAASLRNVHSIASVVAADSVWSIEFAGRRNVSEVLDSLRLERLITHGCIRDERGGVFATYVAGGQSEIEFPSPTQMGQRIDDDGTIEVFVPIENADGTLWSLYVRAQCQPISQMIQHYVASGALVLGFALAVSLLFASRLQRTVTKPILLLSETAERISEKRDYSVRVECDVDNELGSLYHSFNRMLTRIEKGESDLHTAQASLEQRVAERTSQLSKANESLVDQMNERRMAQQKLEVTRQDLVSAARTAGMAEIATGVLHNVGNVLNSVNICVDQMYGLRGTSHIERLAKVCDMIDEKRETLGEFVNSDPRGKHLPDFLRQVAYGLDEEHEKIGIELTSLAKNVGHIKQIISRQQSYAKTRCVMERTDIAGLIEEALALNEVTLERQAITIRRQFAEVGPIELDKHKVLQILVNLITNAGQALRDCEVLKPAIQVSLRHLHDLIAIDVSDNGIGISNENMSSMFSHGFTTKKDGHGFGLHSAVLAAKEMGGQLLVNSRGVGHGATFTLELPLEPPRDTDEAEPSVNEQVVAEL